MNPKTQQKGGQKSILGPKSDFLVIFTEEVTFCSQSELLAISGPKCSKYDKDYKGLRQGGGSGSIFG